MVNRSIKLSLILVAILIGVIGYQSLYFDNSVNTFNKNDQASASQIKYIALVKPTFTQTAYQDGKFYSYYNCSINHNCEFEASHYLEPELNQSISIPYLSWFNFEPENRQFQTSDTLGENTCLTCDPWNDALRQLQFSSINMSISTITDLDVHYGNITKFDLLIFFHNEYVTIQEFDNMISFIKNGGNVLIFNGNSFFAEVKYHDNTNVIQLVEGHGVKYFEDNKTYIYDPMYRYKFYNQNEPENCYAYKYIGSRYSIFNKGHYQPEMINKIRNSDLHSNITSIEENTVINPVVRTFVKWNSDLNQPDLGVQSYEYFPFEDGGRLIHTGLYSTSILYQDTNTDYQLFLLNLILYQIS